MTPPYHPLITKVWKGQGGQSGSDPKSNYTIKFTPKRLNKNIYLKTLEHHCQKTGTC